MRPLIPEDVACVQSLDGTLAEVVERIAHLDGVETLDDVTQVALYFYALRHDRGALRSLADPGGPRW